MRGRWLRVRFVTPSCAYVSGWGSRELLSELVGRPPVWSNSERAHVAQPSTARDAVAAAEARGWSVVVEGQSRPRPAPELPAAPAPAEPQELLW